MQVYCFVSYGYNGSLIKVETDIKKGSPSYEIFGISEWSTRTTRENIMISLTKENLMWPERIRQTLSPVELRKEGDDVSLALALDIINMKEPTRFLKEDVLVLGSLNSDGEIVYTKSAYAAALQAKEKGVTNVICCNVDAEQIKRIPDMKVGVVNSLSDSVRFMENPSLFVTSQNAASNSVSFDNTIKKNELPNLNGLYDTARAIEVAVAGKHNICLTGQDGGGKNLILNTLLTYLTPNISDAEYNVSAKIHSLAGLHNINDNRITLRMPHSSSGLETIFGGGVSLSPGEISLAHNGILFLENAPEYRSSVLQSLRVPLEKKYVTLSRAGRSTTIPANFQLALTANPCPCGNFGCDGRICLCSNRTIESFNDKFRKPIGNYIEIQNFVKNNFKENKVFDLEASRKRITKAYEIQRKRGIFNRDLDDEGLSKYCSLDKSSTSFFTKHVKDSDLNQYQAKNILRISLTLANMEGREKIILKDIKEAYNLNLDAFKKEKSISLEKNKDNDMSLSR